MRKETVEITFLTYLRPPPIAQPRVLDDEPEARVRHAGEPEEPRDHGRRPTPDRVAARDLRSEPEQLFVGAPALEDPLLVAPGAPRAFEQAAALARAAFQKYGVDDVGAVAKAIIEWVMLKGGTDNMTCVIQVLDKDSLKKLDSRTVGRLDLPRGQLQD